MEREKEKNNLMVKKADKHLHQVIKDNTHSGESCWWCVPWCGMMRMILHLCGPPPQTLPGLIRRKTSDKINPSWGAFYETSDLHSSRPYRSSKTRKVTGVLRWAGGYPPKPGFNPWSRNWDSTRLTVRPKQNKEILRNCHGQEAPKEIGWLNVIQYHRWDPGRGKQC